MKKIILLSLISFCMFNIANSMDENLNNNNEKKLPELPEDILNEITLKLIDKMQEAKTLSELQETTFDFCSFAQTSKSRCEKAKEALIKKIKSYQRAKKILNEKTPLRIFNFQRKSEIRRKKWTYNILRK